MEHQAARLAEQALLGGARIAPAVLGAADPEPAAGAGRGGPGSAPRPGSPGTGVSA